MSTLPATGVLGDQDAGHTNAEFGDEIEDFRDFVSNRPGGGVRTELTIASGAVVPGVRDHGGNFTIDTEGDASTDDLDVITYTNMPDGSLIRVWGENASRVVTLKHGNGGSGEMLMTDSADFALDAVDKWVLFERRSSSWVEVSRSEGDEGLTRWESLAYEKIVAGTVSAAATLDITGLSSTYHSYKLVFDNLAPASDGVALWLRLSDDGGSSYEADASDYAWSFNWSVDGGTDGSSADPDENEIQLMGNAGNGTNETISGEIEFFNPAGSGVTQVLFRIIYQSSAPALNVNQGGGQLQAAGATTAFRLLFASGNIATMNYVLYGVKA